MPIFKPLACLSLLSLALPAHAQQIAGVATAIDGDSLAMTGFDIRLFGIDSPELRQTCTRGGATWECGREAADALRTKVIGSQINCGVKDIDVYGRSVSTCTAGRTDLALAMVRAGLTTVLPGADENYREEEASARARRVGLWAGTFDLPKAWRDAHPRRDVAANLAPSHSARRTPAAQRASSGSCSIKGNQSRRMGEAIYYLPGMKYYDETKPEALFCSEREAMAAGYRRSRSG